MTASWLKAATTGEAAEINRLIAGGQDVDALDRYGQTALMLTTLHGHIEAAHVLISAGANLDHTAKYHLSALMLAAINDRFEIASMLVEAGADTTITGTGAPGFHGKTAFDLATDLKRELISELLEAT